MPVSDSAFEAVKARLSAVELKDAVRTEAMRNSDIRLGRVEETISRLTWLIVAGIVGAFIAFVVNGGLSNVAGG